MSNKKLISDEFILCDPNPLKTNNIIGNLNQLINFDLKLINDLKEKSLRNLINKQAEDIINLIQNRINYDPEANYVVWISNGGFSQIQQENINHLRKNNIFVYEIIDNKGIKHDLIIWGDVKQSISHYQNKVKSIKSIILLASDDNLLHNMPAENNKK